MASVSKQLLSSTTAGEARVVGTSRDTIHTVASSAYDEIWIYATNNGTTRETLTIMFGGTSTDTHIVQAIDAKSGLTLVVPGLILYHGYTVYAASSTASTISLVGYVNRIS